VRIEEGLDVELVDDRVLVPERRVIVGHGGAMFGFFQHRGARGVHGNSLGAHLIGTMVCAGCRTWQMWAGALAGSSRMKWRPPCHVNCWPVSRSCTSKGASAARPSSEASRLNQPDCVKRGSRLTMVRI